MVKLISWEYMWSIYKDLPLIFQFAATDKAKTYYVSEFLVNNYNCVFPPSNNVVLKEGLDVLV